MYFLGNYILKGKKEMKLFKEKDNRGNEYYVLIDAKLIDRWCDFGGEKHQDNRGNPDHLLELDLTEDEDIADILLGEGFNVKTYIPKNNTDPQRKPTTHLQVKLPYRDEQPWLEPKIRTVVNGVTNDLTKETVGSLDDCIIDNSNLTVRRHAWEYLGRSGITAQLVDGEFYIRGQRSFQPSYRREIEPNQKPDDDLPF